MPHIQIAMAEGRTTEQVRALIAELTEVTVRNTGAPPEAVSVVVTEVPRTHWGSGGVTLADK